MYNFHEFDEKLIIKIKTKFSHCGQIYQCKKVKVVIIWEETLIS